MRIIFRISLVAVLITNLPQQLIAEVTDTTAEKSNFKIVKYKNNADKIEHGIALNKDISPFYPSRASTGSKTKLTSKMFDPPELCGSCHVEIYKQWKGSMHSNAWRDPIYRAVLALASKSTKGAVDKLCIGCHSPIGLVTGEATPAGDKMSEIAKQGVQCSFCHNVSATTGVGNGAFVLTPNLYGRRLMFGPFKDAQSSFHDTAYSELHTKSEFCGQCHNVSHPFNKLPIERTFDEWKDSWYAGQNIQCQDCHMTLGTGVTKKAGSSTPFSKTRDQIYTHFFIGGNVMIPKMLGSEEHSKQAEQMLRAAATIEILPKTSLTLKTMQSISVKVSNIGAGHKLPTGFPEGREMWLDFKMTDANGKVFYQLGKIKDGLTETGTKSFKVILGDKLGNIVDLNLWEADRVLYDTRIPAKGYSIVAYNFVLPEGVTSPVTVTADLNYWSFPQKIVDYLLGENSMAVPITKMASATVQIPIK
ncbi:Cytochrome C553 (soluble cytochrome f) [hydrothermal vent metagenome]|uniref:Cytochrome C553 (Soluble cytochrome f) n=1 Tax=hydrothermal vent metagenome TaxID=652676 RepID=A0A3B1AJ25_9ZZZZ